MLYFDSVFAACGGPGPPLCSFKILQEYNFPLLTKFQRIHKFGALLNPPVQFIRTDFSEVCLRLTGCRRTLHADMCWAFQLSRKADMEVVPLRPAQRTPMNVLLQGAPRRFSLAFLCAMVPESRSVARRLQASLGRTPSVPRVCRRRARASPIQSSRFASVRRLPQACPHCDMA